MNEQLGRSACSTKSASVVIADDDGHVRTALLQLLEEEPGLTVLGTARDADEALVLITEHQPDVIVVDVNMPAGGGPRVAAETARLSPATRVVALSARGDRTARRAMTDAGACRYLVKGEDDLDLVQVIWDVVGSAQI